MKTIFVFLIGFCGLFCKMTISAPGDLDATFGDNGVVITDFFGETDVGNDLKIDAEGNIILAGGALLKDENSFALSRYRNDGSLDETFGDKGKVVTGGSVGGAYGINELKILDDGKILACGTTPDYDIALVRYNHDGTLDHSFGENGIVVTHDPDNVESPHGMAIDRDNKIVVIASSFSSYPNDSVFEVLRYHPHGVLDENFGEAGRVTTRITPGVNVPRAVKIDSEQNIVVGGFTGHNNFVAVKYKNDGSLDDNFGDHGVSIVKFNGGRDLVNTMALQEDGKIILGGDVEVSSFAGFRMIDFGIARLNVDGSLDESFNGTGKVITSFIAPAASSLWDILVDDEGRILAGGEAHGNGQNHLALVRYKNDGSLDENFAVNGKQTTSFGKQTTHWDSLALDANSNIVVGGWVWNGKHYDFGVVRYLGN